MNFCSVKKSSSSMAFGESEKYSSLNSPSFSSSIKLLLDILKSLYFSDKALRFSNKRSLAFLTMPSNCLI